MYIKTPIAVKSPMPYAEVTSNLVRTADRVTLMREKYRELTMQAYALPINSKERSDVEARAHALYKHLKRNEKTVCDLFATVLAVEDSIQDAARAILHASAYVGRKGR